MQRLKLFIPLGIFIVLSIFFWRGLSMDPNEMPSALIDNAFPTFSLPALADESTTIDNTAFPQDFFLVNVWATWCVACKVEHPFLLTLAEQGVAIFGINYKDNSPAAKQWLTELGNPYRANIVDASGRLGIELGVYGAPETYLVDSAGVIRYKHVGILDQRAWDLLIKPVIDGTVVQ